MDEEGQNLPEVRVRMRMNFVEALGLYLRDIFFPENPFRQLRGQPPRTIAWRIFKHFVPFFDWFPGYNLKTFGHDVLSGITIASLAIPQGISYARLANLPAVYGLYPSFVPPLVYAIFGSSTNLAVGPVAAASLLLGTIISEETHDSHDLYIPLFFTAAFFSGVFQLALGVLRLGFLVDFLSRSTIMGFMGGTATIIILQQLKGMFGFQRFTTKTDIISVMSAIFSQINLIRWQSVTMGIGFLVLLFGTRYAKEKKPHLFWVSALSPLTVVIFGGAIAYNVGGDKNGIPVIGNLSRGINPISVQHLNFESRFLATTVKAGIISGILALAEGIAVGRSLAILKNEQVDGNKEMVAFGMMNVVGSMTSCYLTSGPFSKSAVNYQAGCRTAMSNVVMSVCMVFVLLFLAPFFAYTPLVALSAIIISAMVGLIECLEMCHLFKVDKFDFVACMAAFLGVVFFRMDVGLGASVGISVVRVLLRTARPLPRKLGRFRGTSVFRDVVQYPDVQPVPGVLVVQPGSPIWFSNCGYLRERLLRWLEEAAPLQFLVLDMGGVSSIDKTGIDMLDDLSKTLTARHIRLAMVNPRMEVGEKLAVSAFLERTVGERLYHSVAGAVENCLNLIAQENAGLNN